MRIQSKYLDEKLTASDPTSKWISDFVHSDNPKFAGKSKKERIRMALGAAYAAKGQSRNEEVYKDTGWKKPQTTAKTKNVSGNLARKAMKQAEKEAKEKKGFGPSPADKLSIRTEEVDLDEGKYGAFRLGPGVGRFSSRGRAQHQGLEDPRTGLPLGFSNPPKKDEPKKDEPKKDEPKKVKEDASPMIKAPKNEFATKSDAFAHANKHGGKVVKKTFTHPTTGQQHVSYVVKEEVEELDEVSAEVAKRVAQARDKSAENYKLTPTQSRRLGMGNRLGEPDLNAAAALKSAMKRGAKDVYKEEVELDEVTRNDPLLQKIGPIRTRDNTTGRISPEDQKWGKEQVKQQVKTSIQRMKTDKKPNLPEEVEELDEISQKLATAAYAKRTSTMSHNDPVARKKEDAAYERIGKRWGQKGQQKADAAADKYQAEEVEQIDELDQKTLSNYATRTKFSSDPKRREGAAKAQEKLDKKSKNMQKEEAEQVDEVLDSAGKFMSYTTKAAVSGLKSAVTGTGKFRKRQAGIQTAVRKTKEKIANEEVDESIGSTIGGAIGQYAGSKLGMDGPGRAHGELAGRAIEYHVRKFANRLKKKITGKNEEVEVEEENKAYRAHDKISRETTGMSLQQRSKMYDDIQKKLKDQEEEYRKQGILPPKNEEAELEEGKKKGLWDNIHAKRKRGERPARPGEKGYPKTLNIEETELEEAGRLQGGGKDPCWKGYKMVGTKKKGGRDVPNCVPTEGKQYKKFKALREELNGDSNRS